MSTTMSIDDVISFLSNKKTTIWAVLSAILVWALGRGYVAQDTAQLFANIGVILGLAANAITQTYYNNKKVEDAYIVKSEIAEAVADANLTCVDTPKTSEGK